MKDLLVSALRAVGAEEPARRAWAPLKARGLTPWRPLVPEDELGRCMSAAVGILRELNGGEPLGDYLEFGVSRGTSLACAYNALEQAGERRARLIGFDSFEGLPEEAAAQGWRPGDYRSTLSATRRYLLRRGVDLDRVRLVEGWFDDTLTDETRRAHGIGKAGLVMVDCDIHSASRQALEFAAPHVRDRAVVMLDDWGWREEAGEIGQREAFAEFLADHPDIAAEPLPSYFRHARVFLLTRGG
jgi:O-methyltransferase